MQNKETSFSSEISWSTLDKDLLSVYICAIKYPAYSSKPRFTVYRRIANTAWSISFGDSYLNAALEVQIGSVK